MFVSLFAVVLFLALPQVWAQDTPTPIPCEVEDIAGCVSYSADLPLSPEPTLGGSDTFMTAVNTVNVRSCASTACDVLLSERHGRLLQLLGEVDGQSVSGSVLWYHVRTLGEFAGSSKAEQYEGYVHSSVVELLVPPTATSRPTALPRSTSTPRPVQTGNTTICTVSEYSQAGDWASVVGLFLSQIEYKADELHADRVVLATLDYPPCLSYARDLLLSFYDELYEGLTATTIAEGTRHIDRSTEIGNLLNQEMQRLTRAINQ